MRWISGSFDDGARGVYLRAAFRKGAASRAGRSQPSTAACAIAGDAQKTAGVIWLSSTSRPHRSAFWVPAIRLWLATARLLGHSLCPNRRRLNQATEATFWCIRKTRNTCGRFTGCTRSIQRNTGWNACIPRGLPYVAPSRTDASTFCRRCISGL
jgi:hypothetical protein